MKRPFYIMMHNPKKVGGIDDKSSCVYALSHGANALAPDAVYRDKQIWVLHHNNPLETTGNSMLLKDYLAELADALINNRGLKLHLIAFDIKNTDDSILPFDEMQKIISDEFSKKLQVRMIFSTPDDFEYLLTQVAPNLMPGQALGTDEFDNPVEADNKFRDRGFPYVYGHGNSTIFNDLFKPIAKAVSLRDSGNSFELVYPWTVDTKRSFRRYLDLGVDGIMTNKPERLRKLIEEEYADKYELNMKR
jgi:hypothetical protein